MRDQGMILNFNTDIVTNETDSWTLPIQYMKGHAFVFDAVQ